MNSTDKNRSDCELIEKCFKEPKKEGVWEKFVDRYDNDIRKISFYYWKHKMPEGLKKYIDPSELVNELYLFIIGKEALKGYEPYKKDVTTYVRIRAKNTLINFFRKEAAYIRKLNIIPDSSETIIYQGDNQEFKLKDTIKDSNPEHNPKEQLAGKIFKKKYFIY